MLAMKRINLLLTFFIAVLLWSCNNQPAIKAPVAEKIPHEIFDKRVDNYFWMRLSDDQKNAVTPDEQTVKVLDYLNKENEYSKAVLKTTEGLQRILYDEIVGRIKKNDESVPYFKNGYYYYNKFSEGSEYPVYYRKKGSLAAPEEILLDVNKLAEGKDYCSVGGLTVSPDNKTLLYSTDFVSRRRYTLNFLNLETGLALKDKIENTSGQAIWAADSRTIFYVTKDMETLRSDKVFRHFTGDSTDKDKLVFNEEDITLSVSLSKTKSEKFIIINSSQTLTTECLYLDAARPESDFKIFEPRSANHEYSIDHIENEFFIRTNSDESPNFRFMKTTESGTGKENWVEIIPHRKDILFENFELFDNYIVAEERIKGLTNLRILNTKDGKEHYLNFEEDAYTAGININPESGTSILRFSYSSLTTPNSVIDYNMDTREKKVMKEEEVLGGFDKNNYESRRLWAKASDGTMIPVSIVYKKGYKSDGKSPLLLYAYGSYGYSTDPSFRSAVLSLLDRGFVYAIAHVRGGSEMGRYWYEDGKLFKKKNTFTDFNDCAQYLVNEKYTNREKLFAMGGSAGGLLMGAIANMRPDLYKGIIAAVPFVDVVSTMIDETIPLTSSEWDEWGDPKKKEYYDYILSYSPYDQVKAIDYTNILVTTGFWDSQVQYWEPAKWVAKLRDMKTDKNTLVMDVNMAAGHGGASGRFERYRITALEYAFIIDLAGIRQ
jgi:oligopeptidase B